MVQASVTTMADPRRKESIPDLVREAIADARDWIKAEIDLLKAQVLDAGEKYLTAAGALALAAVLAVIAVIFLAIAAALFLKPYLGDAGATLAVGGVFLLAAIAAAFYGRAKIQRAKILPSRGKSDSPEGDS